MSRMYCSIRSAAPCAFSSCSAIRLRLVLPAREVDADRAADDQHAADEGDDQQRVLREQAPARRHSGTGRARTGRAWDAAGSTAARVTARLWAAPRPNGPDPSRPPLPLSRAGERAGRRSRRRASAFPGRRSLPRPAGSSSLPSPLPSSTPHWSKLLMPQTAPAREDAVLVERDQRAERARRQPLEQQGRARPVAGKGAVRGQRRRSIARDAAGTCGISASASAVLRPSISACDCARPLASSMRCWRASASATAASPPARASACFDQDELDRDRVRALVQHLEVGVLAVGARLAPDHRAGRVRQRARLRGRRACRCSPSRAAADRRAGASGPGGRARRCGW